MVNRSEAMLKDDIAHGFPDEPRPAELLRPGTYLDDEIAAIKEFFTSNNWKSMTAADVSRFRSAPGFFTPSALAYFLPGFLIACIDDPEQVDTAPTTLIGRISEIPVRHFTPQQRELILRWVEQFREAGVEEDYVRAKAHLQA